MSVEVAVTLRRIQNLTHRTMPRDPKMGVSGPVLGFSITATNLPKTWYHCTQICIYIMGRLHDSGSRGFSCNVDSMHTMDRYLTYRILGRDIPNPNRVSQDLLRLSYGNQFPNDLTPLQPFLSIYYGETLHDSLVGDFNAE